MKPSDFDSFSRLPCESWSFARAAFWELAEASNGESFYFTMKKEKAFAEGEQTVALMKGVEGAFGWPIDPKGLHFLLNTVSIFQNKDTATYELAKDGDEPSPTRMILRPLYPEVRFLEHKPA